MLIVLVLVIVLPIQRLTRGSRLDDRRPPRAVWPGAALLIVLIAITILPFLSLLTTALHPSDSIPPGIEWPSDPQWGNFLEAFNVRRTWARCSRRAR